MPDVFDFIDRMKENQANNTDSYGNSSSGSNPYSDLENAINNGQSFEDWFHNFYGYNPDSFQGHVNNFFNGNVEALRSSWQQYYDRWSLAKQQAYEAELNRTMRRTEYQDLVSSLQAAGLNPYAVLSGNFGNVQGFSTTTERTSSKFKSNNSDSSDTAKSFLKLISLILIGMKLFKGA